MQPHMRKGQLTSITSIHIQTTKSHDLGFHLYFCHFNPSLPPEIFWIFEKIQHVFWSLNLVPPVQSHLNLCSWHRKSSWSDSLQSARRKVEVKKRMGSTHGLHGRGRNIDKNQSETLPCMEYWPKLMVNVGKYSTYMGSIYGNDKRLSFLKNEQILYKTSILGFMLVFWWE